MFGKIMSLPDDVMEMYYTLLTDLPVEAFRPLIASRPRDAKVALAKEVIGWLHDREAADAAEAEFVKVFSSGGVPDEMPEFEVGRGPHKIAPLMVRAGLASSNSEAIRKIREGAVQVDGQKVGNHQQDVMVEKAMVLKLGRRFARVRP
jgi:tyrosyl-tRNA synthetase